MCGIETGEKTVAPWSLGSLRDARVQIQNATSAANTLLQRITTEASSQGSAPGNDPMAVISGSYLGLNQAGQSEPQPLVLASVR